MTAGATALIVLVTPLAAHGVGRVARRTVQLVAGVELRDLPAVAVVAGWLALQLAASLDVVGSDGGGYVLVGLLVVVGRRLYRKAHARRLGETAMGAR